MPLLPDEVTSFLLDSVRRAGHSGLVAEIKLTSSLQYIKGVGPRRAEVLGNRGLTEVRDLLFYFPRTYLDRTRILPISQLKLEQTATIVGKVKAHGLLHGRKRRYEVILEDATGTISLIWFQGIRYWEKLFKKEQSYAATGPVTYFMGYQMIHPELERLEDDSDRMIHAGRIIPVYPQTADLNRVGLTSRGLRRLTSFIFDNLSEELTDPLPESIRDRMQLPKLSLAIRRLHYPDQLEVIEHSRRRVAFDELLAFQFMLSERRGSKESAEKTHRYGPQGPVFKQFRRDLPFQLTNAQTKVLAEILDDLGSGTPMARLLQGDVGCGKTVVAILVALYVVENNLQTAFMAPTEILAEQHYRNWGEQLAARGISSELLTAGLRKTTKEAVAQRCASGETSILFGTHALIYDYVRFSRLGLVIIDEQHRFGVQQRGKLYAKGDLPDLLVMTATPIPRTLALTLYGDLDISTIDAMPPGRQPTRTVWRTLDVRDKVYDFVKDEIGKGGQVYFVYPVIERDEGLGLESAEDAYAELRSGTFSNYRVGLVHGRQKAIERNETLRRFNAGELDILVATTVIEVGLDNPGATVMIIEHAERFGLAQLHQLRGRIGRGERRATLVALAHTPISDLARQRLEMFSATTDGFEIAEADLNMRGPGEMFGVRQSGLPEFRAARLGTDRDLIEAGQQLVTGLMVGQERLDSEHRSLYSYLKRTAARAQPLLGGG